MKMEESERERETLGESEKGTKRTNELERENVRKRQRELREKIYFLLFLIVEKFHLNQMK